jgi:hypothetical protein
MTMKTLSSLNSGSVSPELTIGAADSKQDATMSNENEDIVYEVDEQEQSTPALLPPSPMVTLQLVPQSTPTLAAQALAITTQEWSTLGQGSDPITAASSDLNVTVERLVSLALIRIVALVSYRQDTQQVILNKRAYKDLSTSTICKTALSEGRPWMKPISAALISQLRLFVRRIFEQYRNVPYHNFEHAYHVTISANKLLDLILCEEQDSKRHVRPTYGLKYDPLSQLALIFSAIVHDVEHQGISNRQLVHESDELALLYNDQSVAEQRSLAIAFSELRKDEYQLLRDVIFETTEDYHRFRKAVINLVLSTDIASPERSQLVKSKWKEAFGETTKKAAERKERMAGISRRSVFKAAAVAKQVKQQQSNNNNEQSAQTLPVKWNTNSGTTTMTTSIQSLPAKWNSGKKMRTPPTVIPHVPRRRKPMGSGGSTASIMTSNSSLVPSSSNMGGRSAASVMTGVSELTLDSGVGLGVSSKTNDLLEDFDDLDVDSSPSITPESSAHDGHEPEGIPLSSSFETARHANLANRISRAIDDESEAASSEPPKIPVAPALSRALSGDSFLSSSARSLGEKLTGPGLSSSEHIRPGDMRSMLSRRFSSPDMFNRKRTNVRIGIRRTLDLTGEAIENYSVSHRSLVSPNVSIDPDSDDDVDFDLDETDELRATVVMEQILRAADVAPNIQGWDHMEKWSSRLFFELMESYSAGRGENPQNGWYDNQITFLEWYILPLARQLNDTGCFGETIGSMFAQIVLENKERWIADGFDLTCQVIQEWDDRAERS